MSVHILLPPPVARISPRSSRERRRLLTHRLFLEAQLATTRVDRELARESTIVVNMGVARSIARRYAGRGLAVDDLEQVAYLALVRAVDKFDVERGGDFMSYAVPTITGEIKKHFRDHGWAVRPPRPLQELQLRVLEERALMRAGGATPSTAEIADRLQVPARVVLEALLVEGCFNPTSLDVPLNNGDGSLRLSDVLPEPDDHRHFAAEARAILQPLVQNLTTRDRRILAHRYTDGLSQREIGALLGISQMQVSRLLSRIIQELREAILGDDDNERQKSPSPQCGQSVGETSRDTPRSQRPHDRTPVDGSASNASLQAPRRTSPRRSDPTSGRRDGRP